MRELIAAVELALDPQVWSQLAIPTQSFIGVDAVNTLSAHARDAFTSQGCNVARRHVDHLLKVLLFEGELRPGLAQQELLDLLGDYFINSATRQGYAITEADISDIRDGSKGSKRAAPQNASPTLAQRSSLERAIRSTPKRAARSKASAGSFHTVRSEQLSQRFGTRERVRVAGVLV